jgi:tRNA1Val (adenine37-N6)-methyltransferase
MSNPYFSFKRFTVYHDRCAMKVGTDGVLLGAWTEVTGARRILDVGTGTGLIALMLAQRTEPFYTLGNEVCIQAIDIDEAAVLQARENVKASPWSERIEVNVQDVTTMHMNRSYDLIVSNPPYYNSLRCPDQQRHLARHTDSLSFGELASAAARALTAEGRLAVVIPTDAEREFLAATAEVDLFPQRRLLVHTKPSAPAKRVLLQFGRKPSDCVQQTLVLEDAPGVRSQEYQALAGDFYLK